MRINRLGLVPVSSMDPAVRRYRLARLDEVALETPPNGSDNGARADVTHIDRAIRGPRTDPLPGIRDWRAS